MVKSFILDTNIFLHSGADVVYGFEGGKDPNNIIVTGTTLQELDAKKGMPGELGYNARCTVRLLDQFRQNGDLLKGVLIGKVKLYVAPNGVYETNLPPGYSVTVPDNRIISACITLAKRYPRSHFVLVTNDASMRINADVCFRAAEVSIEIEEYRNDHLTAEPDYRGFTEICDGRLVDALYHEESIPYDGNLVDDEFAIVKEGSRSAIAVYEDHALKRIKEPSVFGVKRLYNAPQIMAMWALLEPPEHIPLVILTGAAGSGKTFLPVAAGIDQTYGAQFSRRGTCYDKMIVSRSNALNRSEEIGFLPGDLNEKMNPLIAPIRDSIQSLLRTKNDGEREDCEEIDRQVSEIFETSVEILPMLYIRGRNLYRKFTILDEAQNITKQQVKDVLTRAADGTKIVIVGDPGQIDNTVLDSRNNGLTYAWNTMRGKGVAEIHFSEKEVVRSPLAKMALERLK